MLPAKRGHGDLTHEGCFTSRSLEQLFRTCGYERVDTFESPPIGRGASGAIRRTGWAIGVLPFRLLARLETGRKTALTRNLLAVIHKSV